VNFWDTSAIVPLLVREADICYYSDLRKMRAHFPAWNITVPLEETIRQIVAAWKDRL